MRTNHRSIAAANRTNQTVTAVVSRVRAADCATADNPRRVPFVAEMWRTCFYPVADKQLTSLRPIRPGKLLIRIVLA